MAGGDDNSFEVNLEFPNNTGPAVQGFQNLAAVSTQIRADMDAIRDGMDGITERAEKMREYWQQNVELVTNMKSILEIIQTINQSNQSALNNNLTQINEILSSVKGLGGNMGQAMNMLGLAGGSGRSPSSFSNYGNYQQYMNDPFLSGVTTNLDFSDLAPDTKVHGMHHGKKPGVLGKIFNRVDEAQEGIASSPLASGGSGGGGMPPRAPGGAGPADDDGDDLTGKLIIPTEFLSGTASPPINPKFRTQRAPVQYEIRDQLKNNYSTIDNIVPEGQEGRAAEYAYHSMMNTARTVFGNGPLGRQFNRHFRNIMNKKGITLDSIKRAQENNTELTSEIDFAIDLIRYFIYCIIHDFLLYFI